MSAKESTTPAYSASEGEFRPGTGPVEAVGEGAAGGGPNDRLLNSLESLLGDVVRKGPEQVDVLLAQLLARIRDRQRAPAGEPEYAVSQHHPTGAGTPVPGRPPHRTAGEELRPLERHGHGGQGQPASFGHRRPYLHLCFGGEPLRGGLQPFLPGRRRRGAWRSGVFSGPCVAGQLRPRLRGAPAEPRASSICSGRSWPRGAGCPPIPILV